MLRLDTLLGDPPLVWMRAGNGPRLSSNPNGAGGVLVHPAVGPVYG